MRQHAFLRPIPADEWLHPKAFWKERKKTFLRHVSMNVERKYYLSVRKRLYQIYMCFCARMGQFKKNSISRLGHVRLTVTGSLLCVSSTEWSHFHSSAVEFNRQNPSMILSENSLFPVVSRIIGASTAISQCS